MSHATTEDSLPSYPPTDNEHLVGPSESLASIAIRYNSTPSELAQLNKLSSHMIFPGQKLKIPTAESLKEMMDSYKKLPVSASMPITISNRVELSSQFSSYVNLSLDKNTDTEVGPYPTSLPRASPGDELSESFMRIRAKYITQNKGCVHGKLFLTPKSIMFEPSLTDHLVGDRGKDEFAVILSMDSVTDLTVTSDFTKFLSCQSRSSPRPIPGKSPLPAHRQLHKEPSNSPVEFTKCEPPVEFELLPEDCDTQCQAELVRKDSKCDVTSSVEDLTQPMFLRLSALQTPLDTFEATGSIFSRLIRPRTDSDSKRPKNQLEYWFAIPHSHSDVLYAFLVAWNPHINRQNSKTEILDDTSYTLQFKDDHIATDAPSASWDVLPSLTTLREIDHRAAADSVPLPSLVGTASLLNQRLLRELNYLLPSRTVGHDMWLVYSSFVHGISLRTMYRNMEKCNGPVVFITKDDHQCIFGGVISCPLRVSEHYYGTGESFMFRVGRDSGKVSPYHWTGANTFFVKGDLDSISFGGGNGKPAL
eukprot:TRINITY_DN578_c0_g3_i1.p1 TRINITY_DN578_c0_g3~~TRINITY_DN578_c0_g3_i1.p1  ORF type:complete len:533 (+),score=132.23 TRINITY_DN578_c0_g3_i1:624-2222(+)